MFPSTHRLTGLLRRYLLPQWPQAILLALLFCTGIGLQLYTPQVLRRFIDTVQAGATMAPLLRVALLFLGVAVAQRVVAIAGAYVSQNVAWVATNGLRRDLARHVLKLDMSFHNAHTPGELVERIDGDVDRLANFFSEFLFQVVGGLLLTVGVLALLWLEDWRLAAVLALFVAAYVVVHTRGQQMAAPYWGQERQSSAELMGFVEERIAGARDIHTSGAASFTLRRFYELLRNRTWQALRADVMTDVGWTISKVFYELGTVTSMALGAYLFYQGAISLGAVYLVLHYLGMLNGPLNRIADQLEDLQRARIAIARVTALLATQSQVLDGVGAAPQSGRGLDVTFDHVGFGYGDGAPVLRQVSFQLAPGEALGLLGRTGSGKSTIARLLFRLYDAHEGSIRVDGLDLRQWQIAALRQRIGMVTQEVQIFPASVRDNLTLFDASISDAVIWDALRTLGLAAWAESLPQRLETILTGEGGGLSAGEGQLLTLARLFLKDPGLVILDEASSRLDPATEQRLERALDRLLAGRTAIIIAHRLSTVQRANQVLILEEGAVKEYGPAATLAANPASIYAGLLRLAATGGVETIDQVFDSATSTAPDQAQLAPALPSSTVHRQFATEGAPI